ncbi:hypothetical protein HDU67_003930 [Dinochytrium kinnereticum]|nr:hypothetical protein HDU67_003930 [Dinochytrium kinnereticum]
MSFQSFFGILPTTGPPRTSSIPTDTITAAHPSSNVYRNSQPTLDDPLSRWIPLRISTSSGSFLVPCPPGSTISDLIQETNRLLSAHEGTAISAVRTVEGDVCDWKYPVAALMTGNGGMEMLGLTNEEVGAWPKRVHAAFGGRKGGEAVVKEKEEGVTSLVVRNPLIVVREEKVGGDEIVTAMTPEKRRKEVSIFVSYSWQNSKHAVGSEAKGFCDPRMVREYLATQGFDDVWLDIERMTSGQDLFEQIANGLMGCNIVVACISDEYAASKNCVRELNFAVNVLRIPYISLIVGSGKGWQKTKVGLIVGDQLYIDAQDESNLPEKLESLIASLDRAIEALPRPAIADSDNEIDDGITEAGSVMGIATPEFDDNDEANPIQSPILRPMAAVPPHRRPSHPSFAWWQMKKHALGIVRESDRLECARWTKSNGAYVFRGLHWEPVQVIEVGSVEESEAWRMRRIKVRFDARIVAGNKSGRVKLIKKHEEWVDEFVLRRSALTGVGGAGLQVGDEVEYRMFIHVSPETRNDMESVVGSEGDDNANDDAVSVLTDYSEMTTSMDSYDLWPAYIHQILPDGSLLVRIGFGGWFSPMSWSFTGSLKACMVGAVIPGIDPRLYFLRKWLDEGKLFVQESGAIVRRENLADPKNPDITLESLEDIAKKLWGTCDPVPFKDALIPCNIFISHFVPGANCSTEDGRKVADIRLLATEIGKYGHRVIMEEEVVGGTIKEEVEVLERVLREMAKADVIFLCVTPEYLHSSFHNLMINYMTQLLDLPVIVAVTSPLTPVDPSQNTADAHAYLSTLLLKLNPIFHVTTVDLTSHALFVGRCALLAKKTISDMVSSYDSLCSAEEKSHATSPPWLQPYPTEAMFDATMLECLSVLSATFITSDGSTVVAAGYAWVPHIKNIVRGVGSGGKDRCSFSMTVEENISWRVGVVQEAIGKMWRWVRTRVGVVQEAIGKMWRWVRTVREVSKRASREMRGGFVVGERVEVKSLWTGGSYSRFVWWPGIVESLNQDGTVSILLHAITSNRIEGVHIICDPRLLRSGKDPRAWDWWPLTLLDFRKLPEDAPPFAFPAARVLHTCKTTNRHVNDRVSPAGVVWSRAPKPKPVNDSEIPLLERCRLVKQFDNDPPSHMFTDSIVIGEDGFLVEFLANAPRRVMSSFPLISSDREAKDIYVEIEIVELGATEEDGRTFAAVGLGMRPLPPFMMAGWASNSVALNSFIGRRIRDGKTEFPLHGKPFGTGDVVGIHLTKKCGLLFTLNGLPLDETHERTQRRTYLVLSADGPCTMRLNAGQRPFLFQGSWAQFGGMEEEGGEDRENEEKLERKKVAIERERKKKGINHEKVDGKTSDELEAAESEAVVEEVDGE